MMNIVYVVWMYVIVFAVIGALRGLLPIKTRIAGIVCSGE